MVREGSRIEQIIEIVMLAALAVGAVLVLRPFFTSLLWAVILTIATWPTYRRLDGALHGRRTLAAALMILGLFFGVLFPLIVVGSSLADNVKVVASKVRALLEEGPPLPPAWLENLPLIGDEANAYWLSVAADSGQLSEELKRVVPKVTDWLLAVGAAIGGGALEVALSLVVAFFIYRDGGAASERLDAIVKRVAGERALRLLEVAHGTVKGVVYGLIGTALAQGFLAAVGFWVAGVPGPFFLGLLTFFLSVLPIGAPLIWIPATIWLFYSGHTGWGIFMGLWGFLVVSSVDNFLKPILIGRASALPLLLVFLGILGGAIAFGFLGIFIGPTLLAVVFTLVREWSLQDAG